MCRLLLALAFISPVLACAADKKPAVKSVEIKIEPAEAKPGQTVTLKIIVDLEAGYHTYPLVQPDKAAADMVNTLEYPKPDTLIFVGETVDPPEAKKKAEPLLNIDELHYYTGKVVYERRAVVSPKATAGEVTIRIPKFNLSICDKDNCFPAQKLTPEAKFKVLDGSATIEKQYAEEVGKALKDR